MWQCMCFVSLSLSSEEQLEEGSRWGLHEKGGGGGIQGRTGEELGEHWGWAGGRKGPSQVVAEAVGGGWKSGWGRVLLVAKWLAACWGMGRGGAGGYCCWQ